MATKKASKRKASKKKTSKKKVTKKKATKKKATKRKASKKKAAKRKASKKKVTKKKATKRKASKKKAAKKKATKKKATKKKATKKKATKKKASKKKAAKKKATRRKASKKKATKKKATKKKATKKKASKKKATKKPTRSRTPDSVGPVEAKDVRILVVDDEPEVLTLLVPYLQKKGYRVSEAEDGDQALEKILVERPNIVLLDVMMPGLDGWQISRYVRDRPELDHVRIIMASGIGKETNAATAPIYGADAHIDKPFRLGDVDRAVRSLIERFL